MVLRGLDLALRDRRDAVFEEPARHRGASTLAHRDLAALVRAEHERLVVVVADELPALVVRELLVHLDVLAAGQADDPSGLETVQRDLAILLLQSEAKALESSQHAPKVSMPSQALHLSATLADSDQCS